jgi:hypothetical protein
MAKKRPAGRFPDLGQLSLAVIEHLVQPVIGKKAISEAKAPLIEKELRESLAEALAKTEKRFIDEYGDTIVSDAILDLPLANLPSVLKAVRDFYSQPNDPSLRLVLFQQITTTFRHLPSENIESGIDAYLRILRIELLNLSSEIREKLTAQATLVIEDNTTRMADTLERIEHHLKSTDIDDKTKVTGLELVDVNFDEDYRLPTLDIKLRNTGKQIAFLKRATLNVQKVWHVHPTLVALGVVKSSATYDIELPAEGVPYSKSISVSQSIRPNNADRFKISMKVDGNTIYLITLSLIYDGNDKVVNSEQLLLFKRKPHSEYSLSDYSRGLRRNDHLELHDVWSIFINKKILDEVSHISAIKNPEYLQIERFIVDSLPILDTAIAEQRKRFLSFTNGDAANVVDIDKLLDPELDITIRDFGIASKKLDNKMLSHLQCMSKLQVLDLSFNEKITNKGLVHIGYLVNLRRLDLGWTKITDAGLRNLRQLQNLEELSLRKTQISDSGLEHLGTLKNLRHIWLWDAPISDAGLAYLSDLQELVSLNLLRVPITGTGLEYLKNLTKLENLGLGSTNVDDVGLVHLECFKSLKNIDLAFTKITDDGLQYLRNSTALEKLNLAGCQVSKAGLMKLQHLENLTVRLETGYDRYISIGKLI